jgi:magnesium chelatase subunit I
VAVPDFMAEVVAELSQLARQSPHLNQRSGVSVRLTIANYETLVANATRRALRNGESEAVPRVSDLEALISSTQGKVEIESLEEGREEILLAQLVSAAVLVVFRRRVVLEDPQAVIGSFTAETVVHAGDDLPAAAYASVLADMPALSAPVLGLTGGSEDPGVVASAVEFLLEGLHLTKRLNKEAAGSRATYRGR